MLSLTLKARRIPKSLTVILKVIEKYAEPGAKLKNAQGFWENVCRDLGVPNTHVNRKKICKAAPHFEKVSYPLMYVLKTVSTNTSF